MAIKLSPTIPSSLPPSGAAGGDLSGTFPNPSVATVGTSTATNIHNSEVAANAATNANTASTIVKRDGSGNFSAGIVSAALIGNVTGNVTGSSGSCTGNSATTTAANGLATATTTVAISAATAPTSGQVLTATSGTAATWQTPSGGGGTPAGSDTWLQYNNSGAFGARSAYSVAKTGNPVFTIGTGVASGSNLSFTSATNGTSIAWTFGTNNANTDDLFIYSPESAQPNPSIALLADGSGFVAINKNNPGFALDVGGVCNVDTGFSVSGTAGVTAGPFTTITSITVTGGIVTAITGS